MSIEQFSGHMDQDIAGISYDSRSVMPGHLFAAFRGEKTDGHDFIRQAIDAGAVAVLCDEDELPERKPAISEATAAASGPVSLISARDPRKAFALISHNFFRRPSCSLKVIGITGTNGKTTTSYLVKAILEEWRMQVGLIGTIQYMVKDRVYDAQHTTPEALEFQGLLHTMQEQGCSYAVSEVSSHALAQKRVDGTEFQVGIFTNLTRDHLDFHKTMENYFEAKQRLFTELLAEDGTAVINGDDPYGRKLASVIRETPDCSRRILTYGLDTGNTLMATEITNTFSGLRFVISMNGQRYDVTSALLGLPNVYNILSAATAGVAMNIPWEAISAGIRNAGTVRGRFERVEAGQKFLAIIDYAHTDDALERLIATARELTSGKIITVFGCGGDRDRGKRPLMGAVATRLSDLVVMTSDNPRSEDPAEILKAIESGAVRKNYCIEPDRRSAIRKAVAGAGDADIVLIAGKGHETYQEIQGRRILFDDRAVLQESIQQVLANR